MSAWLSALEQSVCLSVIYLAMAVMAILGLGQMRKR